MVDKVVKRDEEVTRKEVDAPVQTASVGDNEDHRTLSASRRKKAIDKNYEHAVAVDDFDKMNEDVLMAHKEVPNAQRDAEALFHANQDRSELQRGVIARDPYRVTAGNGPRTAEDLAYLIRCRPQWANELNHLDDLERREGIEPAKWERDPVELFEASKRYNFSFIGTNGNFVN